MANKYWWIWIIAIGALVVIGMLAEKQYDIFATLPVGQTYHDGACTFISNTNIGTDGEEFTDFSSSSTSWIATTWTSDIDSPKEGFGYYGSASSTGDPCANKYIITYTKGGLRIVQYASGTSYKEIGVCSNNAVYRFRNTDPDAADAVLTCTTTCTCSGKDCGDNGCGGSCGTCSTGYTCSNYQCVSSGGCTSGQTQSCTASNGCIGTQTCSSGAWGTCTTSLQKCSDGSCKTSCGGGGTCPTFQELINYATQWSQC